jgi:SAM-dependent methyltransferase
VSAPAADLPIPPEGLIRRAGYVPGSDVVARYLNAGCDTAGLLKSLVPDGADAILDFGCGAGKVLRHFADVANRYEVWGCDIDFESIDWLQGHMSPPFRFFSVTEEPVVPQPDQRFGLVFALSVFTHIAEDWSRWLTELHRVIAPGGVLVASILGEGMAGVERAGPWDPDRVGMNVLRHGQDWKGGGPTVFHSHWWVQAHWGRAFEIVEIRQDRNPDGAIAEGAQELVVMRRRDVEVTPALLESIEPGEPRELTALQGNLAQLHADDVATRTLVREATARGDAEHEMRVAAEARVRTLEARLGEVRAARGGGAAGGTGAAAVVARLTRQARARWRRRRPRPRV